MGAAAGTPLGVLALAHMQPATARLVLTILLVLAIALLGRGFRFARPLPPLRVLLVGLASGLANGTAGLPGPPLMFAGSWIGAALFRRSKPRRYNQVALGVLAAAAAASAARAVSGLVSP